MMSQDFLLKKVEKHVKKLEIAGAIFNISIITPIFKIATQNHILLLNTSLLIPVLALKNRCTI